MVKKKYAREPLLYIEQRTISTPVAPMQYDYITPKSSSEEVKSQRPTQNRPLKRNFFNFNEEQKGPEPVGDEKKDLAFEVKKANNDKSFSDMSLLEKIDYFLNRPAHAPVIRSEIKTKENVYRGVLTESNEESVFIRVGRRTANTEVKFSEIESIRMLGL